MLLRSSSTPILNSWTPPHYNHYCCTSNTSKDSSSPSHDHNNSHEVNYPQLSRTKSISTLSNNDQHPHHSRPVIHPVFETRQHEPPPAEVRPSTPLQRLFSSSGLDEVVMVGSEEPNLATDDGFGTRQHEPPPPKARPPTPLQRLFSSSSLDKAVVGSEEDGPQSCDHHHYQSKPTIGGVFDTRQHESPPNKTRPSMPIQRLFLSDGFEKVAVVAPEEGVGGGCGGGWIGGDGRSGGGSSGFNECGNNSNNNYHGHGSMEAYYKKMIQLNPRNSLLLGNYAMFLKQENGDIAKAEEYCERAILTNPSDAKVLCLYGEIIWQAKRDAQRAETYFNQAVKSAPNDSYVLASYAKFLWDVEEEE